MITAKPAHSNIRVLDEARSVDFYKRALELKVYDKLDFEDFSLTFLTGDDSDFELELTWNHDQEEPYVIGNGYSHLAVGVTDLEASHQRHTEMGLEPKPLKGLPGSPPKFYFLSDPDGYLVEVVRIEHA